MDDDRSGKIDLKELSKGIRDYGLLLDKAEIGELLFKYSVSRLYQLFFFQTENLYNQIDKDHEGEIDYEEFLEALRVSILVIF